MRGSVFEGIALETALETAVTGNSGCFAILKAVIFPRDTTPCERFSGGREDSERATDGT
jgi:hypothetical protein